MYEEIYSLNFIYSFLLSSFFLLITVIFSFSVDLKLFNKKKINFSYYKPIIIFFLVFCFYSFFFNLFIIIDYDILSYVFLITFLLKVLYIIKKHRFLLNKLNLKFFSEKKIIFIFFIIFYLISILPMSDADSIVIFQNIPAVILNEGFQNFNLARDIEFILFSNTETLLLISSILKSDSFGAQLNLISLVFLITLTYRENKNFLLIVLSSPLIIYFVSAQKLQLFFGILYLLLFLLIHKK